jgi:hypothetical protein
MSNPAAIQAMSLTIGCKQNMNSMVTRRKNASRPIDESINHSTQARRFAPGKEARIVFLLLINQQL